MNTNINKKTQQITRRADLIHIDTISEISKLNCPALKRLEIVDIDSSSFEYNEEYISGMDARVLLEKDKIDELVLHKIVTGVISAVSALHSVGIIHRDIKPENVVISDSGEVKLIDYDIARIYKETQVEVEATKDTTIFGTYGYAPPEQFGFSQTDYSADIYALGKVMLELNEKVQNPDVTYVGKKASAFDPRNRYRTISELNADFTKVNWQEDELKGSSQILTFMSKGIIILVPVLFLTTMPLNLTIISLVVMGMAGLAYVMIGLNTIKVFGICKRSLYYNLILAVIIYAISVLVMGTYQEIGMSVVV